MLPGPLSVLVQEKVQVDDLVEFELPVVFDQLLVLYVVIDAVQLEHEDVRRSAYPGFDEFLLALLLSLIAFNLRLPELFPGWMELFFVNSQLYWAHLVDVLVLHL